ncbi:MAG TPA: carboxypeptidase-like regulatory domain-containing protein, partial [Kofleriaceae bacterium]|nr:carboxypeptidase-like regulatory domain-containing protein [Kofleriaceae bacterium]
AVDGLPAAGMLIMGRSEQAASELLTVDLSGPGAHEVTVPLVVAGVISGRVTDAGDAPVARAEIAAEPQLWGDLGAAAALFGAPRARSGSDGEFRITGLPTGVWRLTAELPGRGSRPATGRAVTGDRDLQLVLH